MKTNLFLLIFLAVMAVWSCVSRTDRKGIDGSGSAVVQPDGTLTLPLENAVCYSNLDDPSSNTAEWSVAIPNTGRYTIWLSSATTDTTDFSFVRSVKVNLQDTQIDLKPEDNKIIRNSSEVNHPYYKADLKIATFFFPEPGDYYIQVISDKITSNGESPGEVKSYYNTRLLSLYLSPYSR